MNSIIMSFPVTPDCGYSTAPSVHWVDLQQQQQQQSDDKVIKTPTTEEYERVQELLTILTKDHMLDHVLSDEQKKKKESMKEEYSKKAKNLQKTDWMYPSVDDILHDRINQGHTHK